MVRIVAAFTLLFSEVIFAQSKSTSANPALKEKSYNPELTDAYNRIDPRNDGWDSEARGEAYGTHPDDSIRSPREALALATRLCKITENKNINYLLTYALAKANLEEFAEAEKLLNQLKDATDTKSSLGIEISSALKSVGSKKAVKNPLWKSSN